MLDFGESKQKYLYIPEPHNDFIFSILSEELGFIGCAIVILLFAIFVWRGILVAMKAPDMFGSLIAVGVTSLVAVQAIINIAVVTGSIPNTGMPLPFFSYGGTALLILLCSMRYTIKYFKSRSKSMIKYSYYLLQFRWPPILKCRLPWLIAIYILKNYFIIFIKYISACRGLKIST